jgi:hypothetical protein
MAQHFRDIISSEEEQAQLFEALSRRPPTIKIASGGC